MIQWTKRHIMRILEIIIILVFMIPLSYSLRDYITGDPSIYFTFYKNFFIKPFSYFPGHVSYGATSPLFVILGAFVRLIFNDNWFYILKLISFLLCGLSICIINRIVNGNLITIFPIIAAFYGDQNALRDIGTLFEVPLVLLSISLLIYFLKFQQFKSALFINGLLYLVRPEMAILSIIINIYLLIKEKNKKEIIFYIIISYIPCIIYVLYMFFNTGVLLPTSAVGRYIRSLEDGTGWFISIRAMFTYWFNFYKFALYFCILACVLFIYRNKKPPILIILCALGIFIPYIIFPTQTNYFIRYTLAFIIIYYIAIGYIMLFAIDKVKQIIKSRNIIYCVFSLLMIFILVISIYQFEDYRNLVSDSMDNTLLNDLSNELNTIIGNNDTILIYEIQLQYSLNARCISMDAIVGSEMINFILKKQSFEDALSEYGISYIVTMNSMNYRKMFDKTPLVDLYIHDLQSKIGDTLSLNGINYEKILTNQMFSNKNLYKLVTSKQIYNDGTNNLREPNKDIINGVPNMWWNSVYRVKIAL